MINIVIFGPPGAGKGTQSAKIMEKYNLLYIATGDILREEIAADTDLGRAVKQIENGGFASDDIIIKIIEKKMRRSDVKGFLFDGFPRTYPQAIKFQGLLNKLGMSLSALIGLEVSKEECTRRLLKRGKVSGRSDDNEEVIKKRFIIYNEKTLPVKEFYIKENLYTPIAGEDTIDNVFRSVDKKIALFFKSVS